MEGISGRWQRWNAPFQPNYRGHIAELDGLRAFGLSLVLIDHFWLPNMSQFVFQLGNLGWIAMDSFFVMSGFLITGILLDSRDKPGYFGNYYARRTLRIFPLYYLMMLIWYAVLRFTDHGLNLRNMLEHWGSPFWYFLYIGNLRAIWGIDPTVFHSVLILAYAPLWSLQIEEQFYLLFPFAVAWLSRKHLSRLMIAAVLLSPILRVAAYFWQPNNPYIQYTELPCHCEGLAWGALIAIRFRSGPWILRRATLSIWTALLLGAACAGSLITTWGTRGQAWRTLWDRLPGYSISSIACACLILWLICFRGSIYTRILRFDPIAYLGRICYGVYLLHPLAYYLVYELARKSLIPMHKNDPMFVVYGIGLSLILASLSWRFFERPFLKLKDRFPYKRAGKPVASVEPAPVAQ